MRRRYLIPALTVLITYLGFQYALISTVSVAQYDESIYLDVARNIGRTGLPIRSIGNGILLLDQTPLYPYLLGMLSLVFGQNILLLRLVTVAFGAGSVLLAFLIGNYLRGPVSGFVAGLLLALNPFFGHYSFFIRMEVFQVYFLLLATFLLIRKETQDGRRYLIGAGLAIMASVLFKVVSVTFLAAAVLYLFIRAHSWRQRITETLWLGIPTLVGIGGWLLMALLEPGQLEIRLNRWQSAVSGGGVIVDPRSGVAAWSWIGNIGGFILGWETVTLLALSLIAYLLAKDKRLSIAALPLLYIATTIAFSLVVTLKESRHVIALIPMSAIAVGIMVDWPTVLSKVRQRNVFVVLALTLSLFMAWGLSPLTLPAVADWQNAESWWEGLFSARMFHNDRDLGPLKEVGDYLASHAPEDSMIVVVRQGPVVGYYADRSYIILYTRELEENIKLLADNEFLVIDRVEFWRQSTEETAALLRYVDENFEIEFIAGDVVLYHKIK